MNEINISMFNYTMNDPNVCVLNETNRIIGLIPSVSLVVFVVGFLALLFHFIVLPRLSSQVQEACDHYIGVFGMCLVFLGTWLLGSGVLFS
jgi:hypothetical protein